MGNTAKTADSLSKEFKRDPTIDNYLRLRETHSNDDIEIAINGGIEFAFKCKDLIEGIGITVDDFLGLLDSITRRSLEFAFIYSETWLALTMPPKAEKPICHEEVDAYQRTPSIG